ncbi:MerR family transcriptional regulator [Sharpea porci]|uniref:MerR family transcriptional regulator n=1 Tax=Sharpea porci TaxID=2652286 RepID=UPI00240A0003|nr:MerR family transcriptional regulator [Sharpea porci]MDD6711217.1 MerR family transcriptional regulator [Sharpea porci]MDY5278344.1 MerR family transcriptional regulator [Sharpea porci]
MYSMREACEQCHLSYETLKYYCNVGLVPNVSRDEHNYRVFDDDDITWINSLTCLKKCGMSLKEIKAYIALCLEGESTIPERQAMLSNKRDALLLKQEEIQASIDFIDYKQQLYDDILNKKIPYHSSLIKKQ